jgi:hypothetical protein
MEESPEQVDARHEAALLLQLARQLREAATRAGRTDVVAMADEVIALLAGAPDPVDDDRKPGQPDRGNAVLRILDGLGF